MADSPTVLSICAGIGGLDLAAHNERGAAVTMNQQHETYTYTIFDADPHVYGGSPWPDHTHRPVEADTAEVASAIVKRIMSTAAVGLSPADGYRVGQPLYALVWQGDTVVCTLTHTLTTADLRPLQQAANDR